MEFRILGPLEVVDGGDRLALGTAKQRALLAVLLLRSNEIVSTDRLIDDLWGERPPETAGKVVQVYVSQLRKALREDNRIVTRAPGYLLRIAPHEVDAQQFELLVDDGRRALASGDAAGAATKLRQALALWRGPPLADLAFEPFAQSEIARLEERRLAALTERIEADLALGRHEDVIAEVEALVAEHPLQERLRGQLMVALYRAGRQAEALQAYEDARRTLAEELGLEPGPTLKRLERLILTQDPALDPPVVASVDAALDAGLEESSDDGDVTFAELVWEHFRWDRERRETGRANPATEASYRRKRALFEARTGRIIDVYWCQREASAAALTVRSPSGIRRLFGREPTVCLHRVSDWITKDAPAVAELLFRCDRLAIDATDSLRGTSQRRALDRVFSAESHLLGLLERTSGKPTDEQIEEARQQTSELLAPVEAALTPSAAGISPRR
jgi:DNA-binding SARP family transcriptional activator